MLFVLRGAIGRVGPNVAGGVLLVDEIFQLRPIVARSVRRRPGPDQAMGAVDADMVLVAESRDRQIDALRPVLGRFGFRVFDRPARVAILLAQFGGVALPVLGNAAFLDVLLLGLGVALLGSRNNRGVDDLAAHGEKARLRKRGVEPLEQNLYRRLALDRSPRQRLAKVPDR